MTTEDMKRHPGVHSRSGSSIWQWRIKAPVDLASHYPSEWADRVSLGTADLREANAKAAALQAEWLARFEVQRRRAANPSESQPGIPPEVAEHLAQQLFHDILATDDQFRSESQPHLNYVEEIRKAGGPVPTSALEWPLMGGLPPVIAGVMAQVNIASLKKLQNQWARRELAPMLRWFQPIASSVGLVIDESTPGVREAMELCLKAAVLAAEAKVKRDFGAVIDTPPAPVFTVAAVPALSPDSPGPVYLRDVFTRWKAAKIRGADAVSACERALKLYEQHTENLPINEVKRSHGDAFRAKLLTMGAASKTSNSRFTAVKSLFNFAERDLEQLDRNPWAGLDIGYRTESRRSPWTSAQLQAFFGLPLFTKYELPKAWNAGADASYWLPILGLYTGARIGELCQLRVNDVFSSEARHFIRISDEAEGNKIKSDAGVRDVPIHSELIRLGFLDYWASLTTLMRCGMRATTACGPCFDSATARLAATSASGSAKPGGLLRPPFPTFTACDIRCETQ
jgi:hypothetical protein